MENDIKINTPVSINFKSLFVVFLTIFFAFERVIIIYLSPLGYVDEVFTMITIAGILIAFAGRRDVFHKDETEMLILMMLLIIIGLAGNYYSKILVGSYSILIDILSVVKIFLAYYWIRLIGLTRDECDQIIQLLAKICRVLVLIMFALYVVSYALNLSLLGEVRHGIKSYRFLFNNPGNYSKLFYFLIPVLTLDLYYSSDFWKKLCIGISLILWISTMRTRGIAFAFCYVLFAFWFFKFRKMHQKVDIIQLLPLVVIALILGWQQIIYYFTSDTQTRGQLFYYGIKTMQDYFPIGAGFGTYGSNVAAEHYSPLYVKYGFLNVYGMGYKHTNFLNDNYWPMIMGQFGLIGVILVVIILYKFYMRNIKLSRENEHFYFVTLLMTGFLLASSIASKSYGEFSMIPVFLLHGIIAERSKEELE